MKIQQISLFVENKPGRIWEGSLMAADAIDYPAVSAPDYMPVEQLRDLQLRRLQATVTRTWQQVEAFSLAHGGARARARGYPFARRYGKNLPFTEKSDLRDTYPFGLFASPMKDVVRLHASSGTTGKPIVVAYTQEDVDVWTVRDGALLCRLRSASRRHHSERLRLRPVHRRPGRALRRRSAGGDGHSRFPAATPIGRSW